MFDNIASIDFGSSSVKMLKAKRGIRNFEITSVVIEEISLDDQQNYNESVKKCLSAILSKEDLADSRLVVSVPSDRVFLRNINFPFTDMSKIRDAIPFEAEENIPYPAESMSMDFQPIILENIEGRSILLAAMKKDLLHEMMSLFHELDLHPVFAGLESNSLLQCYDYFNSVNNETVLLVDIGYSKTVLNIVKNNTLLFTRAIPSGISSIIAYISELMNINHDEAAALFRQLDIDLNSFDANIDSQEKKGPAVTRQKLKKIHTFSCETIADIINDIIITLKASSVVTEFSGFNRIMLSGGGSNIRGIGKMFGDESELPVVFMPFITGYNDQNIRSRFSVCLGTLLVFMNSRYDSIDFLKHEPVDGAVNRGTGRYNLALFFGMLTIFVILVNFGLTMYSVYKSNSFSNDVLRQKYKRYFNTQNIPKDPVAEAEKMVQKDRQELKVLRDMLGGHSSFTKAIDTVTKKFSGYAGFYVKKMFFDGNGITLEGEIRTATDLDLYKKNLLQENSVESVSVNVTDTNRERSLFKMIIKMKE